MRPLRHLADRRPDHARAALAQHAHVLRGGWARPHALVHRGREEPAGRIDGEQRGGDDVVGEAHAQTTQEVRRGGRDDRQLRPVRERDVTRGELLLGIEQVGRDRTPGERLEGQGADEPLRGRRERDAHLRAGLPAEPGDLARLVRRDPAAHAEQHAASRERFH